MRISKTAAQFFILSIEELGISDFELYLFGSRADDELKGGDIDLLIISNKETIKFLKENKSLLLTKMKMKTEDERIDLTLLPKEHLEQNDFYLSLPKEKLIRLYKN